ncbi:MAG: hypothetical protein HOP19_05510 [Acidobacteria bacterium]|nr:hypothetical protein [Acidobacteriota bacterium]
MATEPEKTENNSAALIHRFEQLYAALPAFDSPAYLAHIAQADVSELPAQVLARAYRQLLQMDAKAAAEATLERLLDHQNINGYLVIVRHLARRRTPDSQQWHDEEDLFQAAMKEILKVLPTSRGALAETAWVRFCQNCFTDAWRSMHGRRGERLQVEFAQPTQDNETGTYQFHVETTTGDEAPWHAGVTDSELPRVEALVSRTISAINDPFIRAVAKDQFSSAPSPISSAREGKVSKAPLTEQLNASRFQISRALRSAKARLASELINDPQLTLDREWLRAFLR